MAGGHQRALFSAMKPPEDNERIMIDSMPAMAWRCRPDGFVEFVNRRWLEYTGLSLEQALGGQGWTVAIHPDGLDHFIRSGTAKYRWFLIRLRRSRNDHGDITSNGTESLLT